MFEKYLQDALIIWATIDPIGTMALFTALTAHQTSTQRRRTAIKTVLYAGTVLLGSIVVGQVILTAMGIQLVSFQLSGGIILFLFGLQMIFGSGNQASATEPEHDIAVFPLAIPATASPGAILAVILMTDNHVHPISVQVGTALITVGILAITLLLLLLSTRIIKILGVNGASILTRVMGIILAALSVEFVMNALRIGQWIGPSP
jgi:multiple antibiotic resistance protein